MQKERLLQLFSLQQWASTGAGKENKFIIPKKQFFFCISEFTLKKGHANNDENGAGEEE